MEDFTRAMNEAFYTKVASEDPGLVKKAENEVTAFTRMVVKEGSFLRRVMPPINVTNADLSRAVDTPLPVIIVDREPDAPMAVSVPFATLPPNWYIVGDRYRVDFSRIMTPRFTTDVNDIRTNTADIRDILSANSIKDVMFQEDGRFINLCNNILLGPNVVNPVAGQAMWQTIAGGITRDTVNDALKIMKRTPAKLATATVLVNHVFANDLQKWGFDEVGGELSQEVLINGFAERTMLGARWLFTNKHELVGENTMFMFAEPSHLGKFYVLDDITMHLKAEANMLWWFAYETIGCSIGNTLGVARVDFTE